MSAQAFLASLAWLAAWAGVYLRVIQAVTGVVALLIAVVILLLDHELLTKARWPRYFGASYGVFALQYLAPLLPILARTWLPGSSGAALWLSALLPGIQAACSATNNLLFLACARVLLEKKRTLPIAAWVAGAASFVANIWWWEPWLRLPDAALSAYCLWWLGYAMYRNFSPRRGLAALNLLGGLAYGIVNVIYAMNPVLSTVSGSFRDQLERNLGELANIRSIPDVPSVVGALDATAFGVAFLLKFALFIGALLLIMRSLSDLSPRAGRLALESIQSERKPFVSAEVVARAVGESVGADLAEVGFRLPGLQANKVAWWSWLKDPDRLSVRNPDVQDMADPTSSIVGSVFANGRVEFSGNLRKDRDAQGHYWPFLPGMTAFVTLPVSYQGGIIGCLNLEWGKARPIDATTLLRLRQAAANLAPVLDARRQLNALRSLSERAHRMREQSSSSAVEGVRELLRDLHDVLSPLATALILHLGFRCYSLACSDLHDLSDLPDDLNYGAFLDQLGARFAQKSLSFEVVRCRLKVGKARLGTLVALVAPDRDPKDRPSLFTDYLHRQAVASIVSGALLEMARRNLALVLARAQARFAKAQPADFGPWFRVNRFVAKAVGLPWAAATILADTERVRYGVDALPPEVKARLLELEDVQHGEDGIEAFAADQRSWFLRLPLPSSKSILWFGLLRSQFRPGRVWSSPWSDFLTRLSESADAALVRFERQRLLLEASRMELLAVKVETARLLLHEVRNRALEFSGGVLGVRTALERAEPDIALDRVRALEEEALKFSRLATVTHNPIAPGRKPSTCLRQAVDIVHALEESRLLAQDIALTIWVDPDLRVAVPMELLVLSLRELIGNAVRAINCKGSITITAVDEGSRVDCDVTDNGPGVKPGIQEQLFDFGTTTREGGGGLGLALVRNALITVGGFLELTSDEPGRTTMTLQLPKPDKEIAL